MELPISDYVTDTKSVLDQSIRVLQAMVDVAANGGWLQTALSTMHLLQMIMQGLWWDEGEHLGFKMLPHVEGSTLTALRHQGISNLHQLLSFTADHIRGILKSIFVPSQVAEFMQVWMRLPRMELTWKFSSSTKGEGSGSVLHIQLRRQTLKRSSNARAYVPHFPKVCLCLSSPSCQCLGYVITPVSSWTAQVFVLFQLSCSCVKNLQSFQTQFHSNQGTSSFQTNTLLSCLSRCGMVKDGKPYQETTWQLSHWALNDIYTHTCHVLCNQPNSWFCGFWWNRSRMKGGG